MTARVPREDQRVRYISPFGSPATMKRSAAERHLQEDDERWLSLLAAEQQGAGQQLTDSQRQVGPPRIEELPK